VARRRWEAERTALGRLDLGILGLDERTGVLSEAGSGPTTAWRVAGAGSATWIGPDRAEPVVADSGETIELRGSALATA
jgi:hypothetical protein